MKKIPFYIIILTFYGCQNNNREIPQCDLNVDNGITYTNGVKYNGTCNIFFNDSLLWKTRTYKRGYITKEIGYYVDYGEVEYIGKQKKGLIHGDFISYYPNREISIEGELDMGKYVGEWKYYDDDGSLNKTINYDKKGEKIDSIIHKQ